MTMYDTWQCEWLGASIVSASSYTHTDFQELDDADGAKKFSKEPGRVSALTLTIKMKRLWLKNKEKNNYVGQPKN